MGASRFRKLWRRLLRQIPEESPYPRKEQAKAVAREVMRTQEAAKRSSGEREKMRRPDQEEKRG